MALLKSLQFIVQWVKLKVYLPQQGKAFAWEAATLDSQRYIFTLKVVQTSLFKTHVKWYLDQGTEQIFQKHGALFKMPC